MLCHLCVGLTCTHYSELEKYNVPTRYNGNREEGEGQKICGPKGREAGDQIDTRAKPRDDR